MLSAIPHRHRVWHSRAGNSFLVSGAPIAKNAAVMEFGLDMQVGARATLGLSYDGQLASGSNEHGARARLRVSF